VCRKLIAAKYYVYIITDIVFYQMVYFNYFSKVSSVLTYIFVPNIRKYLVL